METPSPRPLPIIHINAFPGTGKLTIAQSLLTHFQPSTLKLVHNHLLINPADAVLHRTQPGYQNLRQNIRSAIFDTLISEAATYSTAYLFTDFQTSNSLGIGVCEEYRACAQKRGCDFIPIILICDEEVNLERLVAKERAGHGKLVHVEVASKFREGAELYDFKNYPAIYKLDVSRLSVEEAAAKILKHLVKCSPELEALIQT